MGRGAEGVEGPSALQTLEPRAPHGGPHTQAKGQGPRHSGWGWPVHCVPPPQLCPVSQTCHTARRGVPECTCADLQPGPGLWSGNSPHTPTPTPAP